MTVKFSSIDLKSPASTERILRQFSSVLDQYSQQMMKVQAELEVVRSKAFAVSLAPVIKTELQSGGSAPISITNLVGSTSPPAVEDTHANRLTTYPAPSYPFGSLFFETDRTVTYIVATVSGVNTWLYLTGFYISTFANRPADLGTSDTGFRFIATDTVQRFRWTGSGWVDEDQTKDEAYSASWDASLGLPTKNALYDKIQTLVGNWTPLFDHFVNAGNGTTVETDLYSDTIAAGQLVSNGDKLDAQYGGVYVSSATATRQIRIYFAGTAIFDTGALTLSLSAAWTAYCSIIRVSATVIRYMFSFTTEGAALAAYTAVGELTGLTLSGTNILKITGQAAGVGAATNDIVAKLGSVTYTKAA